MSNVKNLFSDNGILWSIRAYDISGNYDQGIELDPSSNFAFSRSGDTIATLGSNLITPSTSSLYDGLDVSGTYFSNSVSALRIPADTSSNRPAGVAGYIRYNTDTNFIEYWNANTNAWVPISEPAPTITSISPLSVPVPDISCGNIDVSVNILGENFGSAPPIVYFIGSDAVERLASSVTNVVAGSQVRAVLPSSVFDASNQEPFAVKLVNSSSSLSVTTIPPNVIDINAAPYFITQSPLPDISNNSLVNPFTLSGQLDISAGDIEGNTLTFTSPSPNPISDIQSGALTLNSSTGAVTGTLSNPGANTTYNFRVQVTDTATNFRIKLYSFNFVVPNDLIYVSGTSLPSPIYVNSGNTIVGGPVVGGFIIYTFTTTASYGFTISKTSSVVQYLIIAGGGGGGPGYQAGGGGAGGVLQNTSLTLVNSTNYTVTVGAGGAGGNNGGNNPSVVKGSNGSNSSLIGGAVSLISIGGGGGASYNNGLGSGNGLAGGSGGGAGATNGTESGGSGTPGPPLQGYAGGGVSGYLAPYCGGGGGGAGAVGSTGGGSNLIGDGGIGITSSITGVSTNYAGGGGGGSYQAGSVTRVANRTGVNSGAAQPGTGGEYGGGYGAFGVAPITAATVGTPNTGGGGGGGALGNVSDPGGSGGSGIVVIRFPSY